MPQKDLSLPPLVGSVVHPTDFSPASERAFVHALAIALLRQTSLALLHIGKEDRPWSEFPQVRALASVLASYDGAAELDRGLDLLLDGLAATLTPPSGR